jgi:lysophospholipase L1-like esterase
MHLRPAIIAIFLLAAPASAPAATAVIGDSLGVGVSMASGIKGLAANGITIRGPRVIEQIKKLSPGTVAYMSLGTNDAVGPVKGLEKSIDAVIAAAERARVKLVWLGPPCVNKAWDKNVRELDGMLRERLAAAKVTYVSMRDAQMCGNELHARDGVHLTMKGYSYMWAKAQSAAAVRVASVESPMPLPIQPAAALSAPIDPLPVVWIGAGAFNWFHPGSILRSPR